MRKLKLVKIVVPEIVAYYGQGSEIEDMVPEYQCKCGMGIDKGYMYCPYCGSEFDWKHVKRPSKKFMKFLDRL